MELIVLLFLGGGWVGGWVGGWLGGWVGGCEGLAQVGGWVAGWVVGWVSVSQTCHVFTIRATPNTEFKHCHTATQSLKFCGKSGTTCPIAKLVPLHERPPP